MNKQIALFDFDGTITTHDTLLEFIKFCKGTFSFYRGFVWNSPYLVAFKLKLIPNQVAKEKVLAHFFGNMSKEEFTRKCEAFASTEIPKLLRPDAIKEIARLKKEGTTVVIVSASPENWIRKWAEQEDLQLIATRLVTCGEKITGKISGNNCYGEEKVRRIKEVYNLSDFSYISAYGDSSGDKPMLALANAAHFKPFRK